MRCSILTAGAGLLVALTLAACAQKETLTDPLTRAGTALAAAAPTGPTDQPPRPPRPPLNSLDDYISISAGGDFTCATKRNGKIYCWGLSESGQTGRYGSDMCASYACETVPRVVLNGADTLRVGPLQSNAELGTAHACIIDASSDAWCWGDGSSGQLGFNSGVGGANPPTKVAGLKFTSIGAGSGSTCGISTIGVYCWGRIENNANAPVRKNSNPNYIDGIVVGDEHACLFETYTGIHTLDCWGQNRYGQAGVDPNVNWNAPFVLRTLFGLNSIRAATEMDVTCVDQSNGTVQCVGDNTWGMLGNGLLGTGYSTGFPQTVGGATPMQLHGVTTGYLHVCALDASSHAWCWGNGFAGQLGNGARLLYVTPQPVAGGLTFRALAAGSHHTCGIAMDNHIYCWGSNTYGQLGNGRQGLYTTWTSSPLMANDPVT